MSLLVVLLALLPRQTTEGLDEARLMIQRGLLAQAEQRLERLLADEPDGVDRARALLLLGNVDYERGSYERALERYTQAERGAETDALVREGAQGNRLMAEQRLARGRLVAGWAARLRFWLVATLILGAAGVGWLVRGSRAPVATNPEAR